MRRVYGLLSIVLVLAVSAAGWMWMAAPAAAPPAVGQAAPEFRLQDQHGAWHSVADYRGQWLVLYFYPKDFTPGCTTQVCRFRDDVVKLRQAGARVIGVSLDDVKSHAEFAAKYKVQFPLLADDQQMAAKAYGVLVSRAGLSYARRDTFLIDPQGRLARHYPDVDPERNSAQVLSDIAALKARP